MNVSIQTELSTEQYDATFLMCLNEHFVNEI